MKKFHTGQIVLHRRFEYRGVIYAADDYFCHCDEWYELMADSQPPKDRPWYHLLVDGSQQVTYVAERNLCASVDAHQIDHPLLGQHFSHYNGHGYS